MHHQASVKATQRLVNTPKGAVSLYCPLHVFFKFNSNQLEKITIEKSDDFALSFSEKHPKEKAIAEWFNLFFQGIEAPFPLPLKANLGTFTWQTLLELQKIPAGKTASYQEIAQRLGNPQGARAVGNACNRNPFPLVIPCHRVIKADGSLGGFAYGSEMKKMLLHLENSYSTVAGSLMRNS